MSTCIDLRSATQSFLMELHQEVSKVWPFPVKPLEFIDESNGAYAYETDKTIQFNLTQIANAIINRPFNFRQVGLVPFLFALYVHELVGHYRVTPLPTRVPFLNTVPEDEQVPYHFQLAALGNRNCIQILKSVPLYNLLLDILFNVRIKVYGKR